MHTTLQMFGNSTSFPSAVNSIKVGSMQPRSVFHQPFVTTLLQFCFTTGGSVDPGPVEEECGTVEMSHKAENPIGKGKMLLVRLGSGWRVVPGSTSAGRREAAERD